MRRSRRQRLFALVTKIEIAKEYKREECSLTKVNELLLFYILTLIDFTVEIR